VRNFNFSLDICLRNKSMISRYGFWEDSQLLIRKTDSILPKLWSNWNRRRRKRAFSGFPNKQEFDAILRIDLYLLWSEFPRHISSLHALIFRILHSHILQKCPSRIPQKCLLPHCSEVSTPSLFRIFHSRIPQKYPLPHSSEVSTPSFPKNVHSLIPQKCPPPLDSVHSLILQKSSLRHSSEMSTPPFFRSVHSLISQKCPPSPICPLLSRTVQHQYVDWTAYVLALNCSAQQCTNGAWCPLGELQMRSRGANGQVHTSFLSSVLPSKWDTWFDGSRWWHCGLAQKNCTEHLMTRSAQTKKKKN